MTAPDQSDVRDAIEALSGGNGYALSDILALATLSLRSLEPDLGRRRPKIRAEIREIKSYLQRSRTEIARLQANDMLRRRIPLARRELQAVVGATEEASNRIIDCAEAILSADTADPAAFHASVTYHITAIFEACAFQDIAGQRIAGVLQNLSEIEARLSRFAEAIGAEDHAGPHSRIEAEQAGRRAQLILNGPPQAGAGRPQAEIDALLAG